VVRKYSAQGEEVVQKPAAATQTWALPILGLFAFFVAIAGVSIHRKRSRSSTRQVLLTETLESDEDAGLE
jgi:hypothetical protein